MQKLLLLHGAIGSSKQFNTLVSLLNSQFEIHTLDFSGHGGNPIPAEPFSIELFANDVLDWMQENKIQTIDIFGYSMGGYVALYLAIYHPEKVGKVFTLATKFNWNNEGAAKEAAMLNPDKIAEKVPAFAKALEQKHGENWKAVLTKTAEMMIDLGNSPTLPLNTLSEIQQPVLVSVGDKDNMVTLEETIAAYRQLKNGQLLVLPQTQHPFEKVDAKRIAGKINRYFSE
ncbi:MAG: alpha/beta fold hydrolase [Bacteroidia bacterium]